MGTRNGCGLSIRVSEDLVALADDLAARLAAPRAAVLASDLVVVPTPGIGSWLEARLAAALGAGLLGDGICANVELVLAGELVRRVTRRQRDEVDPWSIGPMTIAVMGEMLGHAPARRRDEDEGVFAAARATADLFDQLFRWRPDVADDWLEGRSDDPRAALLRRVAESIAATPPHRTLDEATARLLDGDDARLDLPARIQLFGGDSLPGGARMPRVLNALAAVRDVAVHLVVPVRPWFDDAVAAAPRWAAGPPERERGAVAADHALLRSWGTASHDTAALVAQLDAIPTAIDQPRREDRTLLDALRASVAGRPVAPRAPDGSVELHGCVSELRQVEVARDAILHALADDGSLQPGDVAVLCADVPRFAPYLEAVLGDPQGAPALPYVLRDRSVSRAVPLVAATEAALRLVGGRVPRSAVIDLLRSPIVQRRFELDDEDVDRIAQWASSADVRWGLDGPHRARAGLPASYEAGTWRRAIDRLLAGVALPDGSVSEVLGLRAVSPGHELERVGALGEFLEAISALDDGTATARTVASWCEFVRMLAEALFDPGRDGDAALEQLHGLLAALEADGAAAPAHLPFAEFRALFSDRASSVRDLVVSGPGGVTVTSLAPLRNVPFRVVVLLGLDERSVERADRRDVSFGEPRVGDRDARAELRGALLGAVLAASSRLIVTYEAADVIANEPVQPAAVLAELREAIALVCTGGTGGLDTRHPRHAHGDADLLTVRSRPFTFDRGALRRARELRGVLGPAAPTVPRADPPEPGGIGRDELIGFLTAPQRTFLAVAYGIRLPGLAAQLTDELSTTLDDLERWQVTRSLVADALRETGGDEEGWDAYLAAWAAQPDAPLAVLPGRLGDRALTAADGIAPRARDLLTQVARARGPEPGERVAVEVDLAGGWSLRGEPEIFGGRTIVEWTASSHDRHARVAATVDLLLLTAWHPDVDWRAMRVWREARRATTRPLSLRGQPAQRRARALACLDALVALRTAGLTEPLPLFSRVTTRMLGAFGNDELPTPRDLLAAGLGGWTQFGLPGDGDDPAVRFCFDESYDQLCAEPVRPGDPLVGFDTGGSRLLTYSLALLEALCAIDPPGRADVP